MHCSSVQVQELEPKSHGWLWIMAIRGDLVFRQGQTITLRRKEHIFWWYSSKLLSLQLLLLLVCLSVGLSACLSVCAEGSNLLEPNAGLTKNHDCSSSYFLGKSAQTNEELWWCPLVPTLTRCASHRTPCWLLRALPPQGRWEPALLPGSLAGNQECPPPLCPLLLLLLPYWLIPNSRGDLWP